MDPLKENEWERLRLSHSNCSFFHSPQWARVLNASYGHQPFYIACENHRGGSDLLPLMEVSSPFTGKRGVSLPFTDFVPPLVVDHCPADTLLEEAIALGKERGWKYVEFRGVSDLSSSSAAPSMQFWGHNLDLGGGAEAVFDRFDPSVRRAIRKAEKEGVEVEMSTTATALEDFYRLHCQTRRKHGAPPQPIAFFRSVLEVVLQKGFGFIVTARWKGVPAASNIFFHFGPHAIYKFGASNEALQHLRASNLVMSHAIQWYASHDYESLDFGRTSFGNEGLRKFKQGWGTREFQIDYFKYDLRKEEFVADRDSSTGWHSLLLSRLPSSLLRSIGALLYRHMN